MGIVLQPWFLILFAIAGFIFFYSLRERGDGGTRAIDLRLSKWIVLGITMAIVILLVVKVF